MGGATEMKVLFTPEVRAWFGALETILYEKDYFSFKEGRTNMPTNCFTTSAAPCPCVRTDRRRHTSTPTARGFGLQRSAVAAPRRGTHSLRATAIVYLVHRIENNHTAAQYM